MDRAGDLGREDQRKQGNGHLFARDGRDRGMSPQHHPHRPRHS